MAGETKTPRQILEGAFDAGQLVRIHLNNSTSPDRSIMEGHVLRFFHGKDKRDRVCLAGQDGAELRVLLERIDRVEILVTVRPMKPASEQQTILMDAKNLRR